MSAPIIWSQISPFLVGIVVFGIVWVVFSRKGKEHYQDEGWRIVNDDDNVPSEEAGSRIETSRQSDNGAQE